MSKDDIITIDKQKYKVLLYWTNQNNHYANLVRIEGVEYFVNLYKFTEKQVKEFGL